MIDITRYIIQSDTSVVDAMGAIDKGGKGIAFVCKGRQLIGTVSDGDIRRYILSGGNLEKSVDSIAVKECVRVLSDELDMVQHLFSENKIRAIPVVDSYGTLCSIRFDDKAVALYPVELNVPVVIMAGGKGTRLYPYTKILPKPLIPINDIPITQYIMQQFFCFGCSEFTMIVNHQKNMIKAYYSELENSFHVRFVDENEPLGTGGGLKLMEGMLEDTFFFTNCDILIEADYEQIYRHHKEQKNIVTIVCSTRKVIIPYGTVTLRQDGQIQEFIEKPEYSFLINTGFYVLEPRILDYIPDHEFIHITDIIERCRIAGERVGVFPISDVQWSDMGQISGLQDMQRRKEESR